MMGLIERCMLELLVCTLTPLTPQGANIQYYAICPLPDYEITQTNVPWYDGHFEKTRLIINHEYDSPLISFKEVFVLKCSKGRT
jgi:hypothetical protein